MPLKFRLAEFGQVFATRGRAAELRDDALARARSGGHDGITLDFSGVTNVTYSFADELVGKLAAETRLEIAPVNMTANVARSVDRALRRRTGEAAVC